MTRPPASAADPDIIPDVLLRELLAGLRVLRRSPEPGAVIFRLSRNRHGVERLVAERVEGVPLASLTHGAPEGL